MTRTQHNKINSRYGLNIAWGAGYSDKYRRHKMLLDQAQKVRKIGMVTQIRSILPIFRYR